MSSLYSVNDAFSYSTRSQDTILELKTPALPLLAAAAAEAALEPAVEAAAAAAPAPAEEAAAAACDERTLELLILCKALYNVLDVLM